MSGGRDAKGPGWDPRQTYDVSDNELKLMEKRKAMRAQLKAHWQKEITNPHVRGYGGYVFDPQIQRRAATRASMYDYFRFNARNTRSLMLYTIIPIWITYVLAKWERYRRHQEYMSGTVAYEHKLYMLDSYNY